MTEEEDLTEKLLRAVMNGYADELKKFKAGDPLAHPTLAKLKAATGDLKDYLKSKKRDERGKR